MKRYTFHKSERLCSKKLIAQLFTKGNRGVSRFPFRFTWIPVKLEEQVPAQVLFVVPKRAFPKATDRNALKRILRELYRHQKHIIYEQLGNRQIVLSVLYKGNTQLSASELSENFATCVKLLCDDLEKNNQVPFYSANQNL